MQPLLNVVQDEWIVRVCVVMEDLVQICRVELLPAGSAHAETERLKVLVIRIVDHAHHSKAEAALLTGGEEPPRVALGSGGRIRSEGEKPPGSHPDPRPAKRCLTINLSEIVQKVLIAEMTAPNVPDTRDKAGALVPARARPVFPPYRRLRSEALLDR